MKVQRLKPGHDQAIALTIVDDHDQPIEVISGFLRHLHARDCSPNTLAAYAYDLLHFLSFLQQRHLTYLEFTPVHALDLLAYLRALPSRKPAQRLSLVLCTSDEEGSATHLAATTINRMLAAVSSFYEYLTSRDSLPQGRIPSRRWMIR